jgi:hypothetical protein
MLQLVNARRHQRLSHSKDADKNDAEGQGGAVTLSLQPPYVPSGLAFAKTWMAAGRAGQAATESLS